MRGMFLRRAYGGGGSTPATPKIKITGSGSTNCYVKFPDGTMVYSAGEYDVAVGSTLYCYANTSLAGASITLNGNSVGTGNSGRKEYNYVVTKNATINLTYPSGGFGNVTIAITEG